MHADSRKLLWDAQIAVNRIARFTENKNFPDYEMDEFLRAAVERQFEIIGEAFNRLRRVDPDTATMIAELPRIIAFRNVLIHGYAEVDHLLVWGVVEGKLAALRATIENLLAESQ